MFSLAHRVALALGFDPILPSWFKSFLTQVSLIVTVHIICPGIPLCEYDTNRSEILGSLAEGKDTFLANIKNSMISNLDETLDLPHEILPEDMVERVAWGIPASAYRYTRLRVIYDVVQTPNPPEAVDNQDDQEFEIMVITLFSWTEIWRMVTGEISTSLFHLPSSRFSPGGSLLSLNVAEMVAAGVWLNIAMCAPILEVQKVSLGIFNPEFDLNSSRIVDVRVRLECGWSR
ncbi:hypothetical protein K439DRAFT_1615799 [Ramaria rubella]|nr:hypothetical protein K439DRAFT_1615799 [Ramaria rubella]